VACPQFGFTQQVLASTGNPGYVDTRGCGSCACGTSLSCGAVGSITLWPSTNCTSGAADTVTSAGCEQYTKPAALIRSYTVSYSTSGSASCQPTGAATGTGGVALDSNVETICCAP
jgi:hypothetical protein